MDFGKYKQAMRPKKYLDGKFIIYDETMPDASNAQLGARNEFAIGGGIFKGHDLGTREGFSSYTKKLVTPKFLNMSQTKLADLTPEQQKLFNEGNLYVARVKTVYDPKTKTHKLQNVFGDSNKIDVLLGDVIPEDLSNLPEELSGRSVAATKIRKKFIKQYLESLPEGEVINLDATVRKLNETIQEATNGKISITDKQILMDALENKEMNPNNVRKPKDLKEANQLFFKGKGYDVAKEVVDEKAEELNKKYNLEDKGIRFRSKPTSTGKQTIALIFSGGPFKNEYNTETRPFTEQGISELEEIIKPITKTKEFKEYSSKEAQRQGSIKAGRTKVTYNQPELFQYLLEQEGPISREQVIKDFKEFGYDEGILRKAIGNLHSNMYRALDPNNPGGGQFLAEVYEPDQIKNVLDKVKNNFPGDFFNRTFENLLVDAYGENPKKYKPLADKLKKFRQLQKKLKSAGVGDEFIAQLDHVIPFNFLQLVREGKDPAELLRVKAYPGELNSAKFKGALDAALGRAVAQDNKKLVNTINELRSFLPEDMGKLSSDGKKIIDYGAKPFNLKTMYTEQQAKFGEVYKRTQDFLSNPKVQTLLKDAGISLRAIGQLKKLNVPGFLNTFNKILKENPDLRVELGDDFSEIENQYASLNLEGDVRDFVARQEEKKKDPFPYEAALPTAIAAGKYLPKVFDTLVRTASAPVTAAGLSAAELLSDDPNVGLAGLELLYPDIAKKISGKAPKGFISNVLGLQGLAKYGRLGAMAARAPTLMTPLGIGMMGLEGILMGKREQERIEKMKEEDPEAYREYLEDLEEMSRYSAAYGGRIGYADGTPPDDPSKRKFMKIMGGLASIPIVGRFFDVAQMAEKAIPVVQDLSTKAPPYFFKLVDKIKQFGKDETNLYSTQPREKITTYRTSNADYELYEDLNTGTQQIKIRKGDPDGSTGYKEEELTLTRGESDESAGQVPDFYDEYTVRPDSDGKMKDIDYGLEDLDELIEELGPENITVKELQDMGYNVDRLGPVTKEKLGIK